MSRANPFVLLGIFLLFIGVFGGLPFLKGGLYLDSHEGDIYHLLEYFFPLLDGQVPHLDFVTPLGILAFLPLVGLLKAGLPFGAAFVTSQLLVALVLLPMLTYAAWTRLPKRQAIVFGLRNAWVVLTMTYLQAASGVTVAMHYKPLGLGFCFLWPCCSHLFRRLMPSRAQIRGDSDRPSGNHAFDDESDVFHRAGTSDDGSAFCT